MHDPTGTGPGAATQRAPSGVTWTVGKDLRRPECVLATASGELFVSDSRGGVTRILHDGRQELYVGSTRELDVSLLPNGVALEADGSFLIAHLGEASGGVFRLQRDGTVEPTILEVDGLAMPPTNFVTRDRQGRLWATVSTRMRPRDLDYRKEARTGFVVMDDGRGARIVADGLGYTNECGVSPDGAWLYVVETFARRLSRFPLTAGNELGPKQVVAELGRGEFPDGLAFDEDGGVLLACIMGNRLVRVAPGGNKEVLLDAGDPSYVDDVEVAYQRGSMGKEHMYSVGKSAFGSFASIALGGADRRTAYIGSFMATSLTCLRLPFVGAAPVHWLYGSSSSTSTR